MQRVIEGKGLNGVDKNKNEDWSSVWSSLLLHSEFSEHVQILIITLLQRGSTRRHVSSNWYAHTLCMHSISYLKYALNSQWWCERTKK